LLNVIEKKIYIITTTSKGDNEIFICDKNWKFGSSGVSSQSYGISSYSSFNSSFSIPINISGIPSEKNDTLDMLNTADNFIKIHYQSPIIRVEYCDSLKVIKF